MVIHRASDTVGNNPNEAKAKGNVKKNKPEVIHEEIQAKQQEEAIMGRELK